MRRQKPAYHKKTRGGLSWFILTLVLISGIVSAAILIQNFRDNYFEYGATIQGVNCSSLTVEEASQRIEKEINEKTVTIQFTNNAYTVDYSMFEFQVTTPQELEEILAKEYQSNSKEYTLMNSTTISPEKLHGWLETIPDLKEENMVFPQDAFIRWDGNQFSIIPEVVGSWYDFEEVYQILLDELSSGLPENIVLEPLSDYLEVTANSLSSQLEELERTLSTVIHYQLSDGTVYTLDREIMKQWVSKDEDGNYQIDITSYLSEFIGQLDKMVENANQELSFHPTGLENVVNVPIVDTPPSSSINQEEEIARVTGALENGGTYQYTPIYNENSTFNTLSSYVEVDITRQHVWMYVDENCIVDTDTVTGDITISGYATPIGVYFLDSKTTDTILRGYNKDGSRYASWVMFWMPFKGGYGLHDATWRDAFGGTIYQGDGSKGCINLPYDMAEIVYRNIDNNIPIIIYKS